LDAGPYQSAINSAGAAYGVDPNFLTRLFYQENHFRPSGTSSAGAQGFAQFMPATAERYGVNVDDPYSSIRGAAHYLGDLSQRYGGNQGLMAAGYNWGEGNVDNWLNRGGRIPPETLSYVRNITGQPLSSYWKPLGTTLSSAPMPPSRPPDLGAASAYVGTPSATSSSPASSPAAPSIASSVVGAFNPGAGARMAAAGPGMFPQLGAMLNQNAPVTAPGVPAGPGAGNVGPVTGFLPGASTGTGGIGSDTGAVANLPTPPTAATAAGAASPIMAGAQKIADANQPQAGQGGGGQDPGAQQLAQMMAQGQQAQAVQQARMNQFAQMAAQMRQARGAPLHWGSAPPGAGIAGGMIGRPGMGTPTPGGGMVGGGTTLNSLDDLYG
jgi:hypothetical protein